MVFKEYTVFSLILFMLCRLILIFLNQDLVDIDVFNEAKKVIDALQNKEVAAALAWCTDNKSRLKKSKVFLYLSILKSATTNVLYPHSQVSYY